ncbi:PREDICTED: NAI2-like protein [Camelina sativa]|uniref:NAI2-like protein n=1 Tax=Camelina sativa TaxID=90675 RepID=A0ABM0WPG7_CAMSA|nr:PREDICTED: NAI2-like protein [Camelina sativa]
MTISAMRNKCVVLGLAMCLVLSSFHEVSCQVLGSSSEDSLDELRLPTNINDFFDEERSPSISTSESSESENTNEEESAEEETSSFGLNRLTQSEAVSGLDEAGQSSSRKNSMDRIVRDFKETVGSDGVKIGESEDVNEIGVTKWKLVEDLERRAEENESADDESDKHKIYYGNMGERGKESNKNAKFTSNSQKVKSEATSSRQQQYESSKINGGSSSRIVGSLGLGHSGSWRCINPDKNGVKEDEDDSIIIPMYEIDEIIKEESISQDSSSRTSSLIASLTEIVEKHKNEEFSSRVGIGKKRGKTKEMVRLETMEKLKVSLKKFRSLTVQQLVNRADFENILASAARYEEVSLAKVSHISKLSMYKSMIMDIKTASMRVQHAESRIELQEKDYMDKQKLVDAEFASVKALAKRGDMLYVKIFAIKKLVAKLEAEKLEVDRNFEKTVGNLSRVIEEASQAEEHYHLAVRKWKEEKASIEYSYEAVEKADFIWVQFLNTLT